MKKAYLYLENGQVLEGQSFGAAGTAMGELVFTTGMTGCVENLTDPNYRGQLVVFTFPQFGNYGICRADMESPRCQLGGVVVREQCDEPSNFRCDLSADALMKEQNVVGIAGVDTRKLTQMLRDEGVMNAVITTEEAAPDWDAIKAYRVTGAVEAAGGTALREEAPQGEAAFSVAVIDYGAKRSLLNGLLDKGCKLTIYPYNTPAETILAAGHDGAVLSNGPGDPAESPERIREVKGLMGKIPLFGVGLGHQLMALAAGAKTVKMKFGHRGANQPVRDMTTGAASITAQNCGYTVDADSLTAAGGTVRFVNVNDGTCEGADYPAQHAFSIQFDPVTHGPSGRATAFDRFADIMKEGL